MTKFKNTIMGRVFRGIGKVAGVMAPVALGVVSGGASLGVSAAIQGARAGKNLGIGARVKDWLASRKANRGKRKGGLLGKGLKQVAKDTKAGAMSAMGESLGGMTHNIITDLEAQRVESGEPETDIGKGFKKGFEGSVITGFYENNKKALAIAGALVGVGAIILLSRNKRRR
jgi:hypothetical protein